MCDHDRLEQTKLRNALDKITYVINAALALAYLDCVDRYTHVICCARLRS
jgi:hypothetical protein